MKQDKALSYVLEHQKEVLAFLKSKFPLFHLSNFFFRDLQYGIQMFLERKAGMSLRYPKAESIAKAFAAQLERENIFVRIDQQSWAVNYPEFKTPVVKPPVAAKPAPSAPRPPGAAPAVPKPAAPGAAKPSAPAPKPPAPSTPTGQAEAQSTPDATAGSTTASQTNT